MIVHFPIALLMVASGAGIAYLHGLPRQEFRVLTWWCMGIGWIASTAAILSGLLDQRFIAPDAPFRPVLNWHIGTGLALFVVYGWVLYRRWLFGTRKMRRHRERAGSQTADLLDAAPARGWLTVLLVVGALLVVASGWNGGRLVFDWAVNVEHP